jgi:hypothetical protein
MHQYETSVPAVHDIHPNSIESYHETTEARAKRRNDVFMAFIELGRPATDREICHRLGYSDMNAARPRITELVDEGELIEWGKVRDSLTGRRVRVCKIKEAQSQLAFA